LELSKQIANRERLMLHFAMVLISPHWARINRTFAMMRIVIIFACSALLAACAASSRVDQVVSGWVNTPRPPAQSAPRTSQSGDRTTREAQSRPAPAATVQQETQQTARQSFAEE
jgi:hypothetical protein